MTMQDDTDKAIAAYKCDQPGCTASYARKQGLDYHKANGPCPTPHWWHKPLDLAPSPDPTTAGSICEQAADLVSGSRQATHGDKSINFQNTADAWNALLRAKARQVATPGQREQYEAVLHYCALTPLDVANMLEAFKIARRYSGSHNLDDYIDGAGYAGCAGEIAEKAQQP